MLRNSARTVRKPSLSCAQPYTGRSRKFARFCLISLTILCRCNFCSVQHPQCLHCWQCRRSTTIVSWLSNWGMGCVNCVDAWSCRTVLCDCLEVLVRRHGIACYLLRLVSSHVICRKREPQSRLQLQTLRQLAVLSATALVIPNICESCTCGCALAGRAPHPPCLCSCATGVGGVQRSCA